MEHVELTTLEWVHWCNNKRLMSSIGYRAIRSSTIIKKRVARLSKDSDNNVSAHPGAIHAFCFDLFPSDSEQLKSKRRVYT